MNHFCGLLEAKTISCLTCVVPSIFYICICYCQSILCNPIPLAIKFPCVGWTWETVSLTCQCYALSKFHLCWISRSYSDLLRSIWNKKQQQNIQITHHFTMTWRAPVKKYNVHVLTNCNLNFLLKMFSHKTKSLALTTEFTSVTAKPLELSYWTWLDSFSSSCFPVFRQ